MRKEHKQEIKKQVEDIEKKKTKTQEQLCFVIRKGKLTDEKE